MQDSKIAAEAIGFVAAALEDLNRFAISLRAEGRFGQTATTTDIRVYSDGWKIEKYVESPIAPSRGILAVWSIEISFELDHWLIACANSVTNGDYYEEIAALTPRTLEEFKGGLAEAVNRLAATYRPGAAFRGEIDRLAGRRAEDITGR